MSLMAINTLTCVNPIAMHTANEISSTLLFRTVRRLNHPKFDVT